jgi:predicted kinase
MAKPWLIIITGPPCSGKTTLGRRIASELRLPYLHKDGIKELLFDNLGWCDREWSRKLGRASNELLFHFAETQLAVGYSLILEGNFEASKATSQLIVLKSKIDFEAIIIQCVASREVLFQRFKARSESSERHPGHLDHQLLTEFESSSYDKIRYRLEISSPIIEIDTTDFDKINYDYWIDKIRTQVNKPSPPLSGENLCSNHP